MQRDVFENLANAICQPGADDERITLYLAGETSEFIRLNQARVRQATTVRQQGIDLTVVRGQRCLSSRLSMPDDAAQCLAMLQTELAALRGMLALVPEDPHLLLSDTISNSERIENAAGLPDADAIIADLIGAAGPEDLVGFYAAGPVQRAFADSRSQRNWHEVASFHLEWSLFSRHPESRDQAVKSTLAGSAYNPADLQTRMDAARARLAMLEQPRRRRTVAGDGVERLQSQGTGQRHQLPQFADHAGEPAESASANQRSHCKRHCAGIHHRRSHPARSCGARYRRLADQPAQLRSYRRRIR